MSKIEKDIVATLKEKPGLPAREIAAVLGVEYTSLNRPLSQLRESGEIRMEGVKNKAVWFAEGAA